MAAAGKWALPVRTLAVAQHRPTTHGAYVPGVQPDIIRMQCERNKQIYEKASHEIMDFHAKIQDIEKRMASMGSSTKTTLDNHYNQNQGYWLLYLIKRA